MARRPELSVADARTYHVGITPRRPPGLAGIFLWEDAGRVDEHVAVFIDFQNVHLVGHSLFGGGRELYRCVPNPVRLGDLIASRRRRPSIVTSIRVYRGRPDPNHQPGVAAANDAQTS